MPLGPGTRLGPYEVQEPIGRGAMGVVYKAWHEALARPAAVKVLQALAPDPDASSRFRREAQSIAQMRHPNILNVFDFGEFEGVPYMIVELVPGGSLGDRLKAGEVLDRRRTIALLRGLAAGLDYAHSLGVVHRDVKPANVLLGRDQDAILADFGLAKLLQSASQRSATGVATGTPAYMAPEQVTAGAVGPAADRYALATVAYELLTGATPFSGEGVLELMYAHVHRQPPPASERNPQLPKAVDGVLLRGLAKSPEARWDSCGAMVEALQRALDGDPEATPPAPVSAVDATMVTAPSPAPAPPRRGGRRFLYPLVAAGVIAVLLIGLGVVLSRGGARQPSLTVSPTSAAAGALVTITAHNLPAEQPGTIALAGSGRQIGTFKADGKGDVAQDVRIPLDVTGQVGLQLCWGGSCRLSASVSVHR